MGQSDGRVPPAIGGLISTLHGNLKRKVHACRFVLGGGVEFSPLHDSEGVGGGDSALASQIFCRSEWTKYELEFSFHNVQKKCLFCVLEISGIQQSKFFC